MNVMKKDDDDLLHFLHNHTYYAQVYSEMAVLDVEWCDFVVFSNDVIIVDYEYWTDLLEKLEQFYLQQVVPELLSSKIFNRSLGQPVSMH